MLIKHNKKNYTLKYNLKRVEMIEEVTEMPTLAELRRTGGMLGLKSLKVYFAYGLKEEGADVFMPIKKGYEICEDLIEKEGYTSVAAKVLEALERDCPFFFQGA